MSVRWWVACCVACLGVGALFLCVPARWWGLVEDRIEPPHTVAQRLVEFGPASDSRLAPLFAARGLPYPPQRLTLVAIKQTRLFHVYAASAHDQPWRHVVTFPILGASGHLGPKLRQGDRQVPEGVYPIESLNPNSRWYRISVRIGYPNAFDRLQARRDGRTQLGGDIMIHGSTGSSGCLAMGDQAAADLFVLIARTGRSNVRLLIAPVDFRFQSMPADHEIAPAWMSEVYAQLAAELASLPFPSPPP